MTNRANCGLGSRQRPCHSPQRTQRSRPRGTPFDCVPASYIVHVEVEQEESEDTEKAILQHIRPA
jgi:hypothetical protein